MSSEIHSLDQKLQERVTWEPTVPYTSRCVYTWMEDVGDGPARGHKPVSTAGDPGMGPPAGQRPHASPVLPPKGFCWPRRKHKGWRGTAALCATAGSLRPGIPMDGTMGTVSRHRVMPREPAGLGPAPTTPPAIGPAPRTPLLSPGRWLVPRLSLHPGDGNRDTPAMSPERCHHQSQKEMCGWPPAPRPPPKGPLGATSRILGEGSPVPRPHLTQRREEPGEEEEEAAAAAAAPGTLRHGGYLSPSGSEPHGGPCRRVPAGRGPRFKSKRRRMMPAVPRPWANGSRGGGGQGVPGAPG